MARFGGLFLLILKLLIFTVGVGAAEAGIGRRSNPTDFIKSSCRATRYPVLCAKSLSAYASMIGRRERQLVITALSVSISRTRSCAAFMKKMAKVKGIKSREYKAVQDCRESMGDSVDRLSESVKELGRTGRAVGDGFVWHMSNVQTWVSAALTDQTTCLDGFATPRMDGNVKASIRRRVIVVSQLTSNALALINRFASRHRTSELISTAPLVATATP